MTPAELESRAEDDLRNWENIQRDKRVAAFTKAADALAAFITNNAYSDDHALGLLSAYGQAREELEDG